VLPGELRVADYLSLAAKVRGEPEADPRERLAALGIAPLAARRIRDLALEEARAVALTEALTSQATYLFLAEPLVDLDPRATGRVAEALDARTSAGAFVVFATTSPEDARTLGREQVHFHAGKLVFRTTRDEAWTPPLGPVDGRARLLIRSEGARFLLAELASDPTFDEVHGQGAELKVTGKDPIAMARAVAIASRRANAEIDLLTFETVPPVEPAS
jgi:energy-coupling factor transporter ATP-binding protein EcfA2